MFGPRTASTSRFLEWLSCAGLVFSTGGCEKEKPKPAPKAHALDLCSPFESPDEHWRIHINYKDGGAAEASIHEHFRPDIQHGQKSGKSVDSTEPVIFINDLNGHFIIIGKDNPVRYKVVYYFDNDGNGDTICLLINNVYSKNRFGDIFLGRIKRSEGDED